MSVSKLYPAVTMPADKMDNAAAALAHLHAMNNALIAAHEEIGQLRAELHRAEDRIVMVIEERDRWQADMFVYRDMLIELSTQMASIGTMTETAQGIARRVYDMTQQPSQSGGTAAA